MKYTDLEIQSTVRKTWCGNNITVRSYHTIILQSFYNHLTMEVLWWFNNGRILVRTRGRRTLGQCGYKRYEEGGLAYELCLLNLGFIFMDRYPYQPHRFAPSYDCRHRGEIRNSPLLNSWQQNDVSFAHTSSHHSTIRDAIFDKLHERQTDDHW